MQVRVKRAWNGNSTDHPKTPKRRPTPKQWRKMVASEFEAAPKVVINDVLCAVRTTGQPHLPYQILKPRLDSFQVLDAWANGDNTFDVREKMSREVLAVLHLTDEGLIQVTQNEELEPPTYNAVAARHKEIEGLLSAPLPPVEHTELLAERKIVQRQMSVLSFADLYEAGHKALNDGVRDRGLFSSALRILALERQLMKGTLTPDEIANIKSVLLPQSRQSFIKRTQFLKNKGAI